MKPRYEIVPATKAHAEELALTMRQADVEEVAAQGYLPLPALVLSLESSMESFAGLVDGKVVAMFGHSTKGLLSDEAFPWLLASTNMPRHAKVFLRLNRRYIAALRSRYRLLWGWVCETNAGSIRWLGWLGFTIEDEIRHYAPGQLGFRYFHMEN